MEKHHSYKKTVRNTTIALFSIKLKSVSKICEHYSFEEAGWTIKEVKKHMYIIISKEVEYMHVNVMEILLQ